MLENQTFEPPPMLGIEAESFLAQQDEDLPRRDEAQLSVEVFAWVKSILSQTPWKLALLANTSELHRKVYRQLLNGGIPFTLIDTTQMKTAEIISKVFSVAHCPKLNFRLHDKGISQPRHMMSMPIEVFQVLLDQANLRGQFTTDEIMELTKL